MKPPKKTCASCGRVITWRKKWARDWAQLRYCSEGCRRRGRTEEDEQLEERIRAAVAGRRPVTDTQIAQSADTAAEPVRRAARRLVAGGEVELVQDGRVVDPSTAKGSFLIRRAPGR